MKGWVIARRRPTLSGCCGSLPRYLYRSPSVVIALWVNSDGDEARSRSGSATGGVVA